MTGVLISVFLLWYEIDSHNPFLHKFCSIGKKANCNAVLHSKESKILYGLFTWSEIGFTYFTTGLMFLIFAERGNESLSILGTLSIFCLPAIIASIYYQSVVIKQFCSMCLMIQVVLGLEILVVFTTNTYSLVINYYSLLVLFTESFTALLVWRIIKPLLLTRNETILSKRNFNKLKKNQNVFFGLLKGSKKKENDSKGIGIIIGDNKNAPYKVIKVCNPYCPPCAAAHPILEKLVDKGLVELQIIFNSSSDFNNKRALPTRHLVALAARNDADLTQKAIDDWYLPDNKDYKAYSKKYPLNGEIEKQTSKLKAMRTWCEQEKITHTPTFYINDKLLPKEYWIDDLVDVLI